MNKLTSLERIEKELRYKLESSNLTLNNRILLLTKLSKNVGKQVRIKLNIIDEKQIIKPSSDSCD